MYQKSMSKFEVGILTIINPNKYIIIYSSSNLNLHFICVSLLIVFDILSKDKKKNKKKVEFKT